MKLRRPASAAIALAALGAGLAIPAVASAPPITITVKPKVTPNRAGTKAHPQGVKLDVRIGIHIPINTEPPLAKQIDVWFPRAGVYNGRKYPKCSKVVLDHGGPSHCPKGSIMGHGTGNARADTVITHPHITVVNGGQRRVYFYTVLDNPARVQEPVVGKITHLRHGRWAYKLEAKIPGDLRIVAGVPIVVQTLHIWAGRGKWIATTSCPSNHRWAYVARTLFTDGQLVKTTGSVACRPHRRAHRARHHRRHRHRAHR